MMNIDHQEMNDVLPHQRIWQWVQQLKQEFKPPQEAFTQREHEIIGLVAKGYTSYGIAAELFISKKTVDTHRKNIYRKGNFRCVRDVVVYYLVNDLQQYTLKRVLI